MRKTKIVATVGPASRSDEVLTRLIEAGADVLRINYAHDDPAAHADVIRRARTIAGGLGRSVGFLADLPGPKMRTGPLSRDQVVLHPGDPFVLVEEDIEGDWTHVSTNVDGLSSMVSVGDEVYLADGEIVLEVTSTAAGEVETRVCRGGALRPKKGMHLPSAEKQLEAFTSDDAEALKHALDLHVELVGLSFVRDAEDVRRARAALPNDEHRPFLVAKIETRSALENLREIIFDADAVMVARGDLGIQVPLERVPLIQKEIIRTCNATGTPVITATQMLESMTRAPLPTRAEVTDVANAVLDGTDAVMLSEETAIGQDPPHVVQTMAQITTSIEGEGRSGIPLVAPPERRREDDPVAWAVAHAAVQAAADLDIAAILCPTQTGATPRRISAFRPRAAIIGMSDREETVGALSLVWGVIPYLMPYEDAPKDIDEDVERARTTALDAGLVKGGDLVAVVAGSPGPRAGMTDFVRIIRV